jgi:hypothetical protein
MIENFREFLEQGYALATDLWWVMMEDGAQNQVERQVLAARNAIQVQASPMKGGGLRRPTISPEVQQTIEKVGSVIDFSVKFAYYMTKGCWYFTAFNVVCHLFTRLFSVIALTYFVSSLFFGVLTADLSKLESHSRSIQRQFFLIQGPAEHLKANEKISLHIRDEARKAERTQIHIQEAIFHTESLQDSLYLLKYPLMIPLERVNEHLKAIDACLNACVRS